jgi:anti-sigma factor RsiW
MNCARYERMLFLYRPGELAPEDVRALRAHLGSCPRCAEIASSLDRAEGLAERLRRAQPESDDPEALAARIMRAIDREPRPSASGLGRMLDRIADVLERPAVRFAAAAFVCSVTVVFLFQQATLFLSVRELEHRAAARPVSRPTATVAYQLQRKDLEGLPALSPALEEVLSHRPEGDTLVMTADALRSYEAILRNFEVPLPGSPVRTIRTRVSLERMLEHAALSISISLMFQSPEG